MLSTFKKMIQTIKNHIAEVQAFSSTNKEEIENFRIKYLGRNGLLNGFFAEFKKRAKRSKKGIWAGYKRT